MSAPADKAAEKAADKKVDVTRLLPPHMRAQVQRGELPIGRLVAWLLLAGGLCVLWPRLSGQGEGATESPQAAESPSGGQPIRVSGQEQFTILESQPGRWALEHDGRRQEINVGDEGASLADPTGAGWLATPRDGGYILSQGSERRFRVKRGDEGYSVRGPDDAMVCKVKLKDGKFNVYGPDGQRTTHGKLKRGEILVRDEGDKQVLRIGTTDLASAAVLATPIPPPARALLWVLRDRGLLSGGGGAAE